MNKVKKLKTRFGEILKEWIWMSQYIRQYAKNIIIYIFIGITGVVAGLASSVASKNLIDTVISHNTGTIAQAITVVLSLAVSRIVINALSQRLTVKINTDVTNRLRSEIFEKVLSSRWENLRRYHSGEILNRLEGDVNGIANGIVSFIPDLITKSIQFLGIFCIILYYDFTMAIISLLSAPILILCSKYMMRVMRKYNDKIRDINGEILSFNGEVFQNAQFVKVFGLTKAYCANLGKLLKNYRNLQMQYAKFKVLTSALLSFIGLIVTYLCYGWGVWQLWHGKISYGVLTLFLSLSGTLTNTFSALISLAPSAVSTATSAGRIMELISTDSECDNYRSQAESLLKTSAVAPIFVKLDDVSFKYPDCDKYVLKNLNLIAHSGETIAFVGPSGEGKTTLLRLLLGLFDPTCGEITVGSDKETLKICDSTRRLCSFVPQGNQIMSGTIAENLRIVSPDATDAELENVLKLAEAYDYVSKLPNGINTVLSEKGANLSEGQLQRLSIARALLKKAPLLILDEATSALDPTTESKVLKNIMTENPNRICFITTHRTSMLDYADRIFRISLAGGIEQLDLSDAHNHR